MEEDASLPVTVKALVLVAGSWGGAMPGSNQRRAASAPGHQQQPNQCSRCSLILISAPEMAAQAHATNHTPLQAWSASPSLQQESPVQEQSHAGPRCSECEQLAPLYMCLGDKMSLSSSTASPMFTPKPPETLISKRILSAWGIS